MLDISVSAVHYCFVSTGAKQMAKQRKVRVLLSAGEFIDGVICKPRKIELPLPGPDWVIVRDTATGDKVCVHRDGVVAA